MTDEDIRHYHANAIKSLLFIELKRAASLAYLASKFHGWAMLWGVCFVLTATANGVAEAADDPNGMKPALLVLRLVFGSLSFVASLVAWLVRNRADAARESAESVRMRAAREGVTL